MSTTIEAVLTELQTCDTTDEVEQFATRLAERIERLEAENAERRIQRAAEGRWQSSGIAVTREHGFYREQASRLPEICPRYQSMFRGSLRAPSPEVGVRIHEADARPRYLDSDVAHVVNADRFTE